MPSVPEKDKDNIDPDPGGLEFVGAFLADASRTDAAWLSTSSDTPSLDIECDAFISKYSLLDIDVETLPRHHRFVSFTYFPPPPLSSCGGEVLEQVFGGVASRCGGGRDYNMSYPDIFNLSSICLPEMTVRFDHHTMHTSVLPMPAAPCHQGLIATAMGQVDLQYSCDTTSFPVIFDSGASLAITPNRGDFVGPIRPLTNQSLGGLANGLRIDGIGTVHW